FPASFKRSMYTFELDKSPVNRKVTLVFESMALSISSACLTDDMTWELIISTIFSMLSLRSFRLIVAYLILFQNISSIVVRSFMLKPQTANNSHKKSEDKISTLLVSVSGFLFRYN